MQKVTESCEAVTEAAAESSAGAPPSIEPIMMMVDSLSRTLDCIKDLCAIAPHGPIRDKLEAERANLVIDRFAGLVAAMRLSSDEPGDEMADAERGIAGQG
jgi:methyl coenzyme M reductase subunit C-like uncharacterized protein (methanogenesis marker protein 7)